MKRRDLFKLGLGAAAATSVAAEAIAATAGKSGNEDIVEASIATLAARMQAGRATSHSLTAQYLARIARVDRAGPRLNSIIELNPDALAIATALDAERKAKGPRGPLHGIPILLKDNIATGDRMATTAGSLALAGLNARRDAFLAERLRAAGAVILGKTNLSEWANLRSTRSTSGWSGRGGLTRNPYALDRNTSGSSSGSGAAIAASLAAAAVGTETDGSIVCPASACGLVGIKPTVGLVSRSGVIPLSHTQDTAGPMARTVEDAVLLLAAMSGADAADTATRDAASRAPDFAKLLDRGALRGARLGVARNFFGNHDGVDALTEDALAVLRGAGAVLVDCTVPNVEKYSETELEVLLYEFKAGLAAYLAAYQPDAPIRGMADLVAFNVRFREREMPWFGQEFLQRAAAKAGLDSKDYLAALETGLRYSRAEGIDQVMREHRLDALVAPTMGPAHLTDFISGDHNAATFSGPAAVAGYPHVTVPAGLLNGLPVGLSFVAGAWQDATAIRLAYAFEQAAQLRQPPRYLASVSLRS